MSNLKALQPSGQPAEPEGSIRELVLQQGGAGRQTNDNCEKSAGELASLLNRVSGDATREVDHLIGGLSHLRQKLDEEAVRINHEIAEFTSLSQCVLQLTNIVSDGMSHVSNVADAPGVAEETPNRPDPVTVGLEEPTEVTASS